MAGKIRFAKRVRNGLRKIVDQVKANPPTADTAAGQKEIDLAFMWLNQKLNEKDNGAQSEVPVSEAALPPAA